MINLSGFDVITVFIPYGVAPNGDNRPCVVVARNDENNGYKVFRCTTKYEDKSERVKAFYYPIEEWEAAGLDRPTWVDIHEFYMVQDSDLDLRKRGALTPLDKNGLADFIKEYHSK